MITSQSNNKTLFNYAGGFSGLSGLYNNIVKYFARGRKTESVKYDKAVAGNITTGANTDTGLIIPAGAIITGVVIDVLTSVDSASDTATLSVLVTDSDTVEGAGTICSGLTQANLQLGAYVAPFTCIKVKNNTTLKLKAGTENITAGVFRVIVEYMFTEE